MSVDTSIQPVVAGNGCLITVTYQYLDVDFSYIYHV